MYALNTDTSAALPWILVYRPVAIDAVLNVTRPLLHQARRVLQQTQLVLKRCPICSHIFILVINTANRSYSLSHPQAHTRRSVPQEALKRMMLTCAVSNLMTDTFLDLHAPRHDEGHLHDTRFSKTTACWGQGVFTG